jgi:nuclear receptor interaction protein
MDDEDDYVAPSGLSSRKRMHDVYRITQNNDMERECGNQDAVITVSAAFHTHRYMY